MDGERAAREAADASVIADVAREVASGAPPPRTLPFFGLDHPSGTRLELLDELAARGIFRKYEHVLLPGAGLAASARYLAVRLGCTATATGSLADAERARALTARAALDWQVFHTAAAPQRLPFATAAFTHVWIVESLPGLGPVADVLAEAARVLRPGGHFAVQDLAGAADDAALVRRGHAPARAREAALRAAGFVEIVVRDVSAGAREHRSDADVAWRRLARRLGDDHALVRERTFVASALAAGRLRVVQLTARRP